MKVNEILIMLKQDGWYLATTRRSHRQFRHPIKSGRVTIPGKPGDDLAPGTLNSILKQAKLKEQPVRYAIVVEKAANIYSAYVSDLPGAALRLAIPLRKLSEKFVKQSNFISQE